MIEQKVSDFMPRLAVEPIAGVHKSHWLIALTRSHWDGLRILIALIFCSHLWPSSLIADDVTDFGALQQFEKQLYQIGEHGRKGVVAIAVLMNEDPSKTPAEQIAELLTPTNGQLPARIGCGAIIDIEADSISILTFAHLLEPALRLRNTVHQPVILVRFHGGDTARGQVLAADPRSDLAILQVSRKDSSSQFSAAQEVPRLRQRQLQVGAVLVAVGNPFSLIKVGKASLGVGVIANTNVKRPEIPGQALYEKTLYDLGILLEINLAEQFQTSGTLLLTREGELGGIVTATASSTGSDQTTVHAISMSEGIQRIASDLQQGYEVEYGFLGVSPETSQPEDLLNLGLADQQRTAPLINRVAVNSPAELAGIQRDDLILRVNHQIVETSSDLIREIGYLRPGTTAEILLSRRNQGLQTLMVRVGKWPIYDDTSLFAANRRYPLWRGLEVDFPTGRRRYFRDRFLSKLPAGVVISAVQPGTPAASCGLQIGQFIVKVEDQSVATPEEFYLAVRPLTGEVKLDLGTAEEILLPEIAPLKVAPNSKP